MFDGEPKYIPKIGVSPKLQNAFREKQKREKVKLMRASSAGMSSPQKHTQRLVTEVSLRFMGQLRYISLSLYCWHFAYSIVYDHYNYTDIHPI